MTDPTRQTPKAPRLAWWKIVILVAFCAPMIWAMVYLLGVLSSLG